MAVKDTAPKKDRKPARSIEQQIEDLRLKSATRTTKAQTKATTTLAEVQAKIVVAESKLGNLYAALAAAQATLGVTEEPTV